MTIAATGSNHILSKTMNTSTCTHHSPTLQVSDLRFLRICYCEGTRKSSAYQVTQRTVGFLGLTIKMGTIIGILEKPHVHMEAQELEKQLLERLLEYGGFTGDAAKALLDAVPHAIRSLRKPLVKLDAERLTRNRYSSSVARLRWTDLSSFPSIKTSAMVTEREHEVSCGKCREEGLLFCTCCFLGY